MKPLANNIASLSGAVSDKQRFDIFVAFIVARSRARENGVITELAEFDLRDCILRKVTNNREKPPDAKDSTVCCAD